MRVFIVAAARTLIAPKGGLHRDTALHDLGALALRHAWRNRSPNGQANGGSKRPVARPRVWPALPDMVILGNALAAGGNPARACALAAFGSKEADVPGNRIAAITIDTQCCGGMDAISVAASRIRSGDAQAVLAGGVESFSQAPLRARRTDKGFAPFTQATFTPWPDRDPDVLKAAADFALHHRITRNEQEAFAITSHAKALRMPGLHDPYRRPLSSALCARMPPLELAKSSGDGATLSARRRDLSDQSSFAITAATVAPEADGAAVVLVVNQALARHFPWAIEIADSAHTAGDPMAPPLAAIAAAKSIWPKGRSIACAEIMESFAAQALFTQRALGIDAACMNRRGGMLAMGHPIGASGAVLVGNLFLELQKESPGSIGLAAIPAAGGLGSAMLLKKP